MLEEPQPRPDSSVNDWIKKPSPRVGQKSQEEPRKTENEYDMDCNEDISPNNVSTYVDIFSLLWLEFVFKLRHF